MGGKYTRNYSERRSISREEKQRIHPVWRGVGCAMIILLPVIGWAGASVLLDLNGKNNWMPIPVDLVMRQSHFLYSYIPDAMLYIKLILAAVIAVILFLIFTFISFLFSKSFGVTDRNDPYYVPPIKRQPRRRV